MHVFVLTFMGEQVKALFILVGYFNILRFVWNIYKKV